VATDGANAVLSSLLGPGDVHHADVLVESQGVPHRRRGVDDVVVARRLEVVLVVAAVHGVALVHHLGVHGVAVGGADLDPVAAARHVAEPARGERHHLLLVAVVRVVALRGAAAVLALLEAVERQHGPGARRDRRRAAVLRVHLAVLAAVRVVALLAVAGAAREVPAGAARAEAGARAERGRRVGCGERDQEEHEHGGGYSSYTGHLCLPADFVLEDRAPSHSVLFPSFLPFFLSFFLSCALLCLMVLLDYSCMGLYIVAVPSCYISSMKFALTHHGVRNGFEWMPFPETAIRSPTTPDVPYGVCPYEMVLNSFDGNVRFT
jgi:hypothetical protein